jgi:hypothetical protein
MRPVAAGIRLPPPYMEGMSEDMRPEPDSWALPERSRPPLLGELVERIDEALATARASEAAVMTVGAAALDAAEQAKRAAELAERASSSMRNGSAAAEPPGDATALPGRREGKGMDSFSARADRVAERLQRLQRLPLSA